MSKFVILLMTIISFTAVTRANTPAEKAYQAYDLRDYNEAGVEKIKEALLLFEEAITLEKDPVVQKELKVTKMSAYYFLGTAIDDNSKQLEAHESAMEIADSLMTELGVEAGKAHELNADDVSSIKNSLEDKDELTLAEAMYFKGISLSQWGNLKGVSESIGRLPEVIGLMERIEMLGYQFIHEYGSYRTLGRINFILPKLVGGDLKKSEQFLKEAYKNSLPEGEQYSTNGFNNLYLAETLHKLGKEKQAIKLLETFLAADFSTLAEGNDPENREALRLAEGLLTEWK